MFFVIGLVSFSIFFINFYFISLIEELGYFEISSYFARTLGESYLPARVSGRFLANHREWGRL